MTETICFAKYFCYLCNMYKYFSIDIAKARQFMRFLKKEKAYLQFRKAFEDEWSITWRKQRTNTIHDCFSFIDHAFSWGCTPPPKVIHIGTKCMGNGSTSCLDENLVEFFGGQC